MGTDIHAIFQARKGGKWVDVPTEYKEGRHYQLFAVLAGVRNGYGFAGVPTGDVVRPIAEPRGLPPDFATSPTESDAHPVESVELMGRRAKWHEPNEPLEVWMGDHSHSWLTGEEMLAWYETAPIVTKTGVLDREAYESWDKTSPPSGYCGGISGPAIVVISDSRIEMDRRPEWTHVRCTWSESLRDELAYFFDEVRRLVDEHGEVRMVFGFDS